MGPEPANAADVAGRVPGADMNTGRPVARTVNMRERSLRNTLARIAGELENLRSRTHDPEPPPRRPAVGVRAGALGGVTATLAGSALASLALSRRAESTHPPIGRYVVGGGARLHVYETGHGMPVVMIHGLSTSLADMTSSGLASALGQDFRAIAIDRPGYGHSDRPRDRVWDPHEQARALRDALSRISAERPIIVGHSFGALVALAWALDEPQSISGLVLLSGFLYPTARADLVSMAAPVIPGVGDVLRYAVLPWVNRLMMPRVYQQMFAPQPVPPRYWDEQPVSLAARPMTIRAVAEDAALTLPSADELSRRYGELDTAITVIAGDADQVTDPQPHTRRFAREVSRAKCRIVPGVGHMTPFAARDAVVAAVKEMAGPRAAEARQPRDTTPMLERADAIR